MFLKLPKFKNFSLKTLSDIPTGKMQMRVCQSQSKKSVLWLHLNLLHKQLGEALEKRH